MDWLVEMLAKIGMEPGTWGSAIGQGVVTGAGAGGLGSLLTGRDVGQGMAEGALLGGAGGAATKGLGMLASPEVLAQQQAKDAALAAKFSGGTPPSPDFQTVATDAGVNTNKDLGRHSPLVRPINSQQLFPDFQSQNMGDIASGQFSQASPYKIQNPVQNAMSAPQKTEPTFLNKVGNFAINNPNITAMGTGLLGSVALNAATQDEAPTVAPYSGPLSKFKWSGGTPNYDPLKFKPYIPYGYAAGGITDLDRYMSNAQNIPNPNEVADPEGYTKNSVQLMAGGGIADLGGYAKGGNLLDGPGDGVSDDIPATIAGKQPARLATGEYVVPSRIVSELGNGSTDAGAKRLDAMVQKVNAGRAKTLKGKNYAKDTSAYKHLPI